MTKKIKNFALDEIISIEHVGEIDTYDFSIPQTHCFFANGVLVHNTGGIEEMSDYVFLLSPYEGLQMNGQGKNYGVLVAKNRFGPTGIFEMYFDAERFRFDEYGVVV
jgi:replicative DNA helicase